MAEKREEKVPTSTHIQYVPTPIRLIILRNENSEPYVANLFDLTRSEGSKPPPTSLIRWLEREIACLPKMQRKVVVLLFARAQKPSQIVSKLSVSRTAVWTALQSASKRLRERAAIGYMPPEARMWLTANTNIRPIRVSALFDSTAAYIGKNGDDTLPAELDPPEDVFEWCDVENSEDNVEEEGEKHA